MTCMPRSTSISVLRSAALSATERKSSNPERFRAKPPSLKLRRPSELVARRSRGGDGWVSVRVKKTRQSSGREREKTKRTGFGKIRTGALWGKYYGCFGRRSFKLPAWPKLNLRPRSEPIEDLV